MKKNKRNLFPLFLSLSILLIIVSIALYQTVKIYKRSLAAPIVLVVQPTPTSKSPQIITPTGILTPTVTLEPKTCGQTGVMTFLVLASQHFFGNVDSGADFIRFVRIDFDNQIVRLIAIPDDILVETPNLSYLNLAQSRLGIIYYQVEQVSTGTPAEISTASSSAVAQALYDNYGVSADHYVYFDMEFIVEAIDQLGGLDINIPASISDGAATFYPGEQHLDGLGVFHYARILPGGGEIVGGWNRIDRQNQIVKALIAKLLEPANLIQIPGLIQQFRDNFTTDLSPELIANLACMADKVPAGQITNVQVEPGMIIGAGPDNSMIADTEKVKVFLQEQLAP
jgi:LCP family protein required for cell wall assembly